MTAALSPLRAIRARCLECAGGRKAVRECPRGPESSEPCAVFAFRMGRNPARAGIGRAMSSEDARITRKRTTQDDGSEREKTGEGVRCGAGGIVPYKSTSCEIPPRIRRQIVKAVETILREAEIREYERIIPTPADPSA